MEKDNRLFEREQISKNKSFYNGGNQYSKRDLVIQRLDNKDRSTICLPSNSSGPVVQTFPEVQPYESILSIQSNVLWDEICIINIPQDIETSYETDQGEAGSERRILLRRSDLSMSEQRRIGDQKVKYSTDSLRIRLEDLGSLILPLTYLRNRIPKMVDQLEIQSDNDVELQKIENAESNWKMEKNNSIKDFCQSQISSKLHQSIEFSQIINQERESLHEKVEQDEAKSSNCQKIEQLYVSEQDHIIRSILVEEQDRVKQTDQSHSVATSSHLDNGRIFSFQLRNEICNHQLCVLNIQQIFSSSPQIDHVFIKLTQSLTISSPCFMSTVYDVLNSSVSKTSLIKNSSEQIFSSITSNKTAIILLGGRCFLYFLILPPGTKMSALSPKIINLDVIFMSTGHHGWDGQYGMIIRANTSSFIRLFSVYCIRGIGGCRYGISSCHDIERQSWATAHLSYDWLTNLLNFLLRRLENKSIDGLIFNIISTSCKISSLKEQSPDVTSLERESGIVFSFPWMWNA
ncbi:MAG: hypothetical protein EZS28_042527 [Streblomastix strix]|uniref:Uncharacterized protein n=1 Tax=Streblomastix strix TaxID=222440 RepID=A0A5J4TTU0_9EUKA|nr:MAG: hypothetical protein EZS28_042527 [Streblomastix strix]